MLSSEREKLALQQQLALQEAELTRAEKTIRDKEQQIQDIRCEVTPMLGCDIEIAIAKCRRLS